jgi:hypothetical protein
MEKSGGWFSYEIRGATSQYGKPGKSSNSNTQHEMHPESVSDELVFVMRMNTSSKTSHG